MSTLALPTSTSTPTPSHLNLALPTLPSGSSSTSPTILNPLLPSSNPLSGLNILSDQETRSNLALPLPSSSTPPVTGHPTHGNVKRQRSASVELKEVDLDDEEGDDEDDEDLGGGGRKKRSGKKKATAGEGKGEYKYSSEIAQMMFVFGEVQDPSQETTRLVEDIVRGQIIEIVTRARLLTHLRSSRFLSAEDLIFLIRDDRGKVNRLRTYLSWKDVRKRAKEEEEGGDVDMEEAEKPAPKGRKSMVKLPWELLTPFGDFLRGLPSKQGRNEDEEEEDEDELQAYHDSMQRLKDADETTKKMTKDEYVHYSDCRQASFTYRKARRFRDFVNFGAYLDVRPNDDIIDILGFLSFEMVRSLCVTALEVRDRHERPIVPALLRKPTGKTISPKRKLTGLPDSSPNKKSKGDVTTTVTIVASPEPVTPHHTGSTADPHPSGRKSTILGALSGGGVGGGGGHSNKDPVSLFASPPSARQPLLPAHVLEAFAQIQREQAANRTKGLGNWRGASMGRGRIALV